MDKKYFAFISYKREDEKFAKWLQKNIEDYRFPTNLNGRTDLPKHIRPVFRDATDLTPGLLSEEIDTALHNSEWLIVICSPRSAKSQWVCKEAQAFIDKGRADHIIPFIIEGVPFSGDSVTECYPDALLKLTGCQELLAANINEMGREAAAVKVVARMFGFSFDTLWQRYNREHRRKRILWGITAALLVIISIIVTIYFVRINREITSQNKIIEEQKKEILHQNDTLKDERNKLLVSQSEFLVSESKEYINDGNLVKGLRLVLYALPKNLEHPDRPYVIEAEKQLRSLEYLQIGSVYSRCVLQHDNSVEYAVFSPDGKYVATASMDKTARVWDSLTGKLLYEPLQHDDDVNSVVFSSDGKYILTASFDGTACIWDAATGQRTVGVLLHDDEICSAEFSPDGKYIVTVSYDNTARVWNAQTGEPETGP